MKRSLFIASLILGFLISSCGNGEEQKETIPNVKTDTVTLCGSGNSAAFPGKIKAGEDINLSFRIAGPIASINVSAGNFVKKGDVLAQIDSRDYRTQLAATEAEYRQIKGLTERVVTLYEKDGVTDNEYDKAVYGLEQITAKYDAHKNALTDTKLIAPYDGYIEKTYYSAKETVSAGMPVVSMIGSTTMEVEINIPISDFAKIEEVESFICTSEIYPGKEYPMEMVGVNRKANLNELYTVYLNLLTPDGYPPLTPGMNVKVEVKYKSTDQEKYLVPINALISGKTGDSVWVYNEKDSTINKREVLIEGINNRGGAIVVSGLNSGEVVVSAGVSALKEGQKVRPIKKQSETNIGDVL